MPATNRENFISTLSLKGVTTGGKHKIMEKEIPKCQKSICMKSMPQGNNSIIHTTNINMYLHHNLMLITSL